MSKKKLVYFSHYIDEELNNENLNFLISEKGVEYAFYYWITYGYLLSEEKNQIDIQNKKQLLHLSQRYRCTTQDVPVILNTLLEYNVIEQNQNNKNILECLFVKEELKEIEKKSAIGKNNALVRWNKPNGDKSTDQDKKPQNKGVSGDKNENIKARLELPKVNPKYQKSRKELEEWISTELSIMPDFYHLKSNQQRKSLIGLFELVNIGLFDLRDMVSVSETLENFGIDATSLKNPSFYISNFYNELLKLINDNKEVGEENDETGFYKRFAEKKFSYILSNDDSENKQLSYLDKYDSDDDDKPF